MPNMTYTQAVAHVREHLIVEASSNRVSDSDLKGFIYDAEQEINWLLALNWVEATSSGLVVNSSSVTTWDITVADSIDVIADSVELDGVTLARRSLAEVRLLQKMPAHLPIAYFYDESKDDAVIEFGPKLLGTATLTAQFLKNLHNGETRTAVIADNASIVFARTDKLTDPIHTEWSNTVCVLAASKVFRRFRMYDEVKMFKDMADEDIATFAAVIGRKNRLISLSKDQGGRERDREAV